MRLKLSIIALAAVLVVGCAAIQTERGKLRTAADSYAAVTQSLADVWEAGKLDREQKEAVVKWGNRAHKALREWRRRLRANGETDTPREEFMRAVGVLNTIWMEAQGDSDT